MLMTNSLGPFLTLFLLFLVFKGQNKPPKLPRANSYGVTVAGLAAFCQE